MEVPLKKGDFAVRINSHFGYVSVGDIVEILEIYDHRHGSAKCTNNTIKLNTAGGSIGLNIKNLRKLTKLERALK